MWVASSTLAAQTTSHAPANSGGVQLGPGPDVITPLGHVLCTTNNPPRFLLPTSSACLLCSPGGQHGVVVLRQQAERVRRAAGPAPQLRQDRLALVGRCHGRRSVVVVGGGGIVVIAEQQQEQ